MNRSLKNINKEDNSFSQEKDEKVNSFLDNTVSLKLENNKIEEMKEKNEDKINMSDLLSINKVQTDNLTRNIVL